MDMLEFIETLRARAKKEEQVHEAVEKLQKELEAERLIHYE